MEENQIVDDEIDLTQIELPEEGIQNGVFVDVIPGKKVDKLGREYKTLTLMIELDQVKSDNSRFVIPFTYVRNRRGETKLRADAQAFEPTLSAAALKKFNAAKFFVAKPCRANVGFATEEGRTIGRATRFMPAGEVKLTPSGKYIREASTAPATA